MIVPQTFRVSANIIRIVSPGRRNFISANSALAAQLPPRPTIKEEDLEEAFLKGSGPGGQKVNKTTSAVQLKHMPTGIVVKSQATRSRPQNRKIARRLLAEKIETIEKGSESRSALKEAIKREKKASSTKKSKRKYRMLEEAGANVEKPHGEVCDARKETIKEERV
ncbi:hypothetical protein ACLMJK_001535 [Lecanora helva]